MDTTTEIKKGNIHTILAYSYGVYFGAFMLGVLAYFLFPPKPAGVNLGILGILILGLGTLLVFWAQTTSRASRHKRHEDGDEKGSEFALGPYKITRSPTHLGIALMLVAFALLMNSVIALIISLLAYVVTRNNFITKEEALLSKKYGKSYEAYKNKVRW